MCTTELYDKGRRLLAELVDQNDGILALGVNDRREILCKAMSEFRDLPPDYWAHFVMSLRRLSEREYGFVYANPGEWGGILIYDASRFQPAGVRAEWRERGGKYFTMQDAAEHNAVHGAQLAEVGR